MSTMDAPIDPGLKSLEGLHGTVPVPPASAGFWRQLRAFVGPALLISVGYMDPGNWGTDLQAGRRFRYGLLWVVALSSLMADRHAGISARLGVVTGKDLAQAAAIIIRGWTRWPNWLTCELAIAACDLAEVLGSAVAINLLFQHSPLLGRHHHGLRRAAAAGLARAGHAAHRGGHPGAGRHDRRLLLHRDLRPAADAARASRRWAAPC